MLVSASAEALSYSAVKLF